MKKILIVIISLLFVSNCYAVQKIFYDPISKKEIVDVSGKKTKEEVEKEFGLQNIQEVTINELQDSYEIVDNELKIKYNYRKEREDRDKLIEQNKKQQEEKIKQKLNLTDEEWEDLKGALGR